MSHFVIKCKYCQGIMTQCRCPDPNKPVTYDICNACKANPPAKILGKDELLEVEIRSIMDHIPEDCRIYVREGAGNEDLIASLAVSVAKLVYKLENK
jgi:hypothetical protein